MKSVPERMVLVSGLAVPRHWAVALVGHMTCAEMEHPFAGSDALARWMALLPCAAAVAPVQVVVIDAGSTTNGAGKLSVTFSPEITGAGCHSPAESV